MHSFGARLYCSKKSCGRGVEGRAKTGYAQVKLTAWSSDSRSRGRSSMADVLGGVEATYIGMLGLAPHKENAAMNEPGLRKLIVTVPDEQACVVQSLPCRVCQAVL